MSIFSSTSKTKNKNYSSGIDGLRAIAVIIVLLFHLGFSSVPGGYVGVDVFFVISGFLITGIIYSNIDNNKFSYIGFMSSRISRLYPALIFTLIFVILFCFLLYSPADFVQVSKSAVYATFSLSNIFFAGSSGYFDNSSEINPLLHTWSLAVEQQFYLVWPIIILLSFRVNKKSVPYIIAFVAVASLVASQWATTNMQVEGYYWTPFRMFELALGGIIFFIPNRQSLPSIMKEFMMISGIALILFGALTFTSSTQFPGLNAMIPVSGAMLCILAHDAKYAGIIVNNKISIVVGLISYSVYLIHWPLIVFYKYWIFRELETLEKILIFFASFFIAYFMYIYIENKYRKINLQKISMKSISMVSSILICAFLFSFTVIKDGFVWRSNGISDEMLTEKYSDNIYGGHGILQNTEVKLGDESKNPSFIIMGDSYSRQYANAISVSLKKKGILAYGFFKDGCFFSNSTPLIIRGKTNEECVLLAKKAMKSSIENNIPIIYAQSWLNYREKVSKDGVNVDFQSDLDYANFNISNILDIKQNIKNEIIIIGLPPVSGSNTGSSSCITRPTFIEQECKNKLTSDYESRNSAINKFMNERLTSEGIKFVNPFDVLCNDNKCYMLSEKGEPLYSDATHLSIYGANDVWNKIYESIEKLI
ncbi:acyltransferase family protein [Providencia zhijiangensis]|uniref:Acyltransferase family protein n=1 Tax=Providencia zhijiangensis TaxID=3053982 RepID=A0ABZ0MYS7_9GAMM|nr:acyltransferase family protein [Providencia sp. D4759]WPA90681.1 acyltransferase family protein [Providencia sp. D4759]